MIERLQQRTRQMAHSVRERGPDIFLVLLVVLVMASAVGVAQVTETEGEVVLDDFESGTIENASTSNFDTVEVRDTTAYGGTQSLYVDGTDGDGLVGLVSWNDIQENDEIQRISIAVNNTGYAGVSGPQIVIQDGTQGSGFRWDGGDVKVASQTGTNTDTGIDVETEEWYMYQMDVDFGNSTYDLAVYDINGDVVGEYEDAPIENGVSEVDDIDLQTTDSPAYVDSVSYSTDTTIQRDTSITIETRDLFIPGNTHPYTVYQEVESLDGTPNESTDVTENATVTTDNSSLLTVNQNGTMSATNDENASAVVNVTASYEGENVTKAVVVAQPTVDNLEILPTGITRVWAVGTDNTIFILLIASFMGVAATRFSGAFAGLAASEMIIVIGWLGGYVGIGMAMVSVFVALFIGLNLAANIDYSVRR